MIIKGNGNIGIGTTETDSYKLSVAGKMRATEVLIQEISNWSDYVFYDNYRLPKLSDVESYIRQNHHLPDVPSEAEVMDKGINLGEMDAILLKKIEELTLYVIELKKENEVMRGEIEKLKEE